MNPNITVRLLTWLAVLMICFTTPFPAHAWTPPDEEGLIPTNDATLSLSDMGVQLTLPESMNYYIIMPEYLQPVTVAQIHFENSTGKLIKIEIASQKIPNVTLMEIKDAERDLMPVEENVVQTKTVIIDNHYAEYKIYSIDDEIPIIEVRMVVNQIYYVISTKFNFESEILFEDILNNLKFQDINNLPINYDSIISLTSNDLIVSSSMPNLKFPYNGIETINCAYYYDNPVCHPSSIYALDFSLVYEPVRAAHSGSAVSNYRSDWGTYITIRYDGDSTYYTYYGHLNSITKTGPVAQGDYIAVSGASGTLATGPHLHFSLNYNGTNIKPEPMCGITGFLRYQVHEDCWVDDTTPPVTSISLSGTTGENSWYRSSVVATITATDNLTGVAYAQYNLDGTGWVTYSTPITISANGSHYLQYRSVDKAGNWETAKTASIKIDPSAPTGSISIMNGWETTYQTSVRLDTIGVDSTSGVASLQLKEIGGIWSGWIPYQAKIPWLLPAQTDRIYNVDVQYKDFAGNMSPIYSDSILLDIYPDHPASQNYQLQKSTFGMSATHGESSNFQLNGTLSQVSATGYSESTLHKVISGFWVWVSSLVNQAPVVSNIPDQTITEGATFSSINLDDYVSDVDNSDSEITWSISGNIDLVTNITNRVASITIPNAEWNGSETITFRATDPEGLSATDTATFTVSAVNDPPLLSNIPDQTIEEGSLFTSINLDEYVSDVDDLDSAITWSYLGNTALGVTITDRVATISLPDQNWNGVETITFKATDQGGLFATDAATFTVTAVNDPPILADIPDQTIAGGATFTSINLDDYVSDIDDPDSEITWSHSGAINLSLNITNRVANINPLSVNWTGSETITFRATDPGGLYDEDTATFTILAPTEVPILSSISSPFVYTYMGESPFTLHVYGENFIDGSLIRWNGIDQIDTVFISETELSIDLTEDDLSNPGVVEISVFTPVPGGGVSETIELVIVGISPTYKEKLTASKVIFDWDDVPDATAYKIKLSLQPDFNVLLLNVKITSSEQFFDTFLNYSKTYYWKIRPIFGDVKGNWSPVFEFTSMDSLAAPTLVSPPHKDYVNSPVELEWTAVKNATKYKVVIAKDALFITTVTKLKTDDTTVVFNLQDGKYYWRVRAIDEFGAKGSWSEIRIFKVIPE